MLMALFNAAESLANDALALKYSGFLASGSQGVSSVPCEFYISKEGDHYSIKFETPIHGEELPKSEAEFFYFEALAPNGNKFYSVDQPKANALLTLASINLKQDALNKGVLADVNNLAGLINQRDLESSMALIFKPDIGFEDYVLSMDEVFKRGSVSSQDHDLLNSIQRMNVVFWHSGHYDTPKCEDVNLEGVVSVVDLDSEDHSSHEHDEYHSGHDHEDSHSHDDGH